MAYTLDLQTEAGGAVASSVPFRTARVTSVLDGPGALDVNLLETEAEGWLSGQRRVIVREDGAIKWAGFLGDLQQDGPPGDIRLTAPALGLRSVLDRRIVHGRFAQKDVVATTAAWNLIAHAQAQTNGDHGFTLGTVIGTASTVSRVYCDGDKISEAIDELASRNLGGFDWEIDPGGKFNAWVDERGSDTGLTLSREQTHEWKVTNATAELLTYVTAHGSAENPCDRPWVIRPSGLVADYGRREGVIAVQSGDTDDLTRRADGELRAQGSARLNVQATFLQSRLPVGWGAVWLGDRMSVVLPAWFGGTQTMRVTEVARSLEPGVHVFTGYTLEVV